MVKADEPVVRSAQTARQQGIPGTGGTDKNRKEKGGKRQNMHETGKKTSEVTQI